MAESGARTYSLVNGVRAAIDTLPGSWRLPARFALDSARGRVEPEVAWLPMLVDPSRGALDIGANHGLFTYRMARLCPFVEAFEPQPGCAGTIEAWSAPNVTVHRMGLSDAAGSIELRIPIVGGTEMTQCATFGPVEGEHASLSVPVARLDDLGFTSVGTVKIDVEGHEDQVLDGGWTLIDRDRPLLIIELEPAYRTGAQRQATAERLRERGYECFCLRQGRWAAVERVDTDTGDTNNFVFVTADDPRRTAIARGLEAAR